MKNPLTPLALGLLLGITASAAVPADQVVLSAGLAFAQGNALDMTHKVSGGYAFEVGYRFRPQDYGVDFLVYGNWKKLPAATASTARSSFELVGSSVGFDVVYKPWDNLPITLATGPSANVWQVEQQGVADGRKGDQGLKLGWRAGLAYECRAGWSLGLTYTLTEWRSTPNNDDPALSIGPARPAFLTLMVSHRF
jgi:hypothetical protein